MSQYEDLLIDALLDYGFTLDEAVRLIKLQERNDGDQSKQAFQRQCRLWLGDDSEHIWN
jgi:hypothetical protein